ncbi:hypothetical protein AB3G45_16900 [Shinella sp. S4-D37]|uniref:hypothetical protein n=1 Tax=Shinella sp. S4-D37 TaxID=3161999 RepID=UPI0034678FC2
MNTLPIPAVSVSPLRQRLIDDMTMRRFTAETQGNYLRDVGRLASFLGRRIRRGVEAWAARVSRQLLQIDDDNLGIATQTVECNPVVVTSDVDFMHTI